MKTHWLQGDTSIAPPRIPLPWAASIMLLMVLPLNFYLGQWNLPLWVSFIVWAEYFALGAKLTTYRVILPSLPFGASVGALWCASAQLLAPLVASVVGEGHSLYVSYALTNLIWVTLIVYSTTWNKTFASGALAVFNGFTLFLAVYFTGSFPPVNWGAYETIGWAFLWTLLLSFFGWFLGWLNVVLTFPSAREK